MNKITITEEKYKAFTIIKPLDNELLFKHCSGGAVSVTTEYFENYVKPLLFYHGIKRISFKK